MILLFGSIFQFFSRVLNNSTLALWSPELYPPGSAHSAPPIVNGIGNVAGAVMPFAAVFISTRTGYLRGVRMIAVMYTLLAVVCRFAPETLGRPWKTSTRLA